MIRMLWGLVKGAFVKVKPIQRVHTLPAGSIIGKGILPDEMISGRRYRLWIVGVPLDEGGELPEGLRAQVAMERLLPGPADG